VQLDATPAIVLCPAGIDELTSSLIRACAERQTIAAFDLTAFNRLIEHKPEDMTATAEAGLTLAGLQRQLALRGQWLPVDPPRAESLTLGALLATNASGPRRFGYGTIRDYVIGLKVALADGRIVSSGGKVVKNVAGYDLAKLFIGSRGSLGVIVEATFKLRPLPETEGFVQAQCESLDHADRILDAVLDSDLTPVVLDLHQSGRAASPTRPLPVPVSLVVGFAGTRHEVDWQLERAAALGLSEPATLDYERQFWDRAVAVQKVSILPSRLIETLRGISPPFVARAGNGVYFHCGAPIPKPTEPSAKLCERLKQTWDPQHILPPPPL
jgi:FAD/FMN-containing dehydrogenase